MSIVNAPINDDGRDATIETLRQAALQATFTGFYHRERQAVLRFLRRLEPDLGMIEEACQDAFLATLARWEDVQDYENPAVWVKAVARNILRDHQRQRGRTPTVFFEDIGMPEIPDPADPHEADELLAGWIQMLPQRMGEVISLSLDDLPDRQIALVLGISHNTVREYKVEARRRLKEMAENDGFSTPAGRRRR